MDDLTTGPVPVKIGRGKRVASDGHGKIVSHRWCYVYHGIPLALGETAPKETIDSI